MNFKRLIRKYSKTIYHLKVEGFHDPTQGGRWIEEVTEKEIDGAVVPLNREDLKCDEGGTWKEDTKKLYSYENMAKGDRIKTNDLEYTIQHLLDYSEVDEKLKIYFMGRSSDG